MNNLSRYLLACILLLSSGCGAWTVVGRHEVQGGAPQKTRDGYLADFEAILKENANLEKSGFRYARMASGYTWKLAPDGFDLTYSEYLSIISTNTREKRTHCSYKDIGELRVLEFGASRGAGYQFEVALGDRCGGLSFWGSSKDRMIELAHVLLMLKRYDGGTQEPSQGPQVQGI